MYPALSNNEGIHRRKNNAQGAIAEKHQVASSGSRKQVLESRKTCNPVII